jgi:cold shock CspA family protein
VIVRGIVETFDVRRGDGIIRSDRGERLYFHCVSIADGSRQIDADVRVEARRRVGHVGRDEAVDVVKVAGQPD